VGFTRDVCENLREFRQGLPDPWRVQAFEANFSYRRLRDAQKCVWRMVDDDWLGLSGVGTDVFRNQTAVMLEQDTEDRRSLIQSECGEDDSEDLLYFEEGKITPL
jgi:hypothetical protein